MKWKDIKKDHANQGHETLVKKVKNRIFLIENNNFLTFKKLNISLFTTLQRKISILVQLTKAPRILRFV